MFGKKKQIETQKVSLRLAINNLIKEHWQTDNELCTLLYAVLTYEYQMHKRNQATQTPPPLNSMEDLMGKLQ